MRQKELGYLIEAIIFVILFVIGMLDESGWILTTGIFLGIFIVGLLSYASRSVFRTKYSYFYPNILFVLIGILLLIFGSLEESWDALIYIIFGLYFLGSAVFAAPAFLIFNDKQSIKERTGQ